MGNLNNPKRYPLSLFSCFSAILFSKGRCYTKMLSEKEIIKKQEKHIKEMEQYIFTLEKENKLQKQLIEMLEQHNSVLQQHYDQYVDTVQRMMNDLES